MGTESAGIGTFVKALREQLGWSQQQLAQKVPLSQRQISRIETHQVLEIPRSTLIRLAEVLQQPVCTGDLNRWLYSEGYRAYIRPRLPLPPNYRLLLDSQEPYPAAIIDVGGYFSACNHAMHCLFEEFGSHPPLGKNLIVESIRDRNSLDALIGPYRDAQIIHRLLWEWSLYPPEEDWVLATMQALEHELGDRWTLITDEFQAHPAYDGPRRPEEFFWPLASAPGSRFVSVETSVHLRPDIGLFIVLPNNQAARQWCLDHSRAEPALT